ncbi:MAG: sigma-70 family RNA polymerase sigma factor [Planctomycetaceae bacterium]
MSSNNSKQAQRSRELIYSCQGLVRSIAWKIHQKLPSSVELDDLIGYGQVGLAEAANNYDPDRGFQFTTFAYYRIRGSILDGLSTMSWFNKADYCSGRYERMANELLDDASETRRADTGQDTEWFGTTARSLSMVYLMSQMASEDGRTPEVVDDGTRDPQEQAETEDICGRLISLVAELPEQERALMQSVYFDGLTLKDAGERIGISKAWASRLHTRILNTLALRLSPDND